MTNRKSIKDMTKNELEMFKHDAYIHADGIARRYESNPERLMAIAIQLRDMAGAKMAKAGKFNSSNDEE